LLLEGIERVAKAEAASARAPKEPLIKLSEAQDPTYNDPAVTKRLSGAIARQIGAQNVLEARPEMVAEDFGEFGKAAGVPSVLLRVGAAEPAKYEASLKSGTPLPSLHSSGFAPDKEPTIKMAATALTLSALELLGKAIVAAAEGGLATTVFRLYFQASSASPSKRRCAPRWQVRSA